MRKEYFILAIVLLVAKTFSLAAGACTGSLAASNVPFSFTSTRTGDASSTTFIIQVCSKGCSDDQSDVCQPLSSVSFGATGLVSADGGSDECGPSISGASLGPLGTESPANVHCASAYLDGPEPNMDLSDVCPSGCIVKLGFANGQSVVATLDGSVVPQQVSPEPVPEPEPEPEPVPETTPSAPSAYGRRRLNVHDNENLSSFIGRRLNQYGKRRLVQYGSRRLNQYGSRRLNQYGSRRLNQYGSR